MRANSLLRRKDPDARRLTQDEILKFKLTSGSKDLHSMPLRERARSAFQSVMHFFTFRAGLNPSQCRAYGHILPRESLANQDKGKCRECGSVVTEMYQLRKASTRHS